MIGYKEINPIEEIEVLGIETLIKEMRAVKVELRQIKEEQKRTEKIKIGKGQYEIRISGKI